MINFLIKLKKTIKFFLIYIKKNLVTYLTLLIKKVENYLDSETYGIPNTVIVYAIFTTLFSSFLKLKFEKPSLKKQQERHNRIIKQLKWQRKIEDFLEDFFKKRRK